MNVRGSPGLAGTQLIVATMRDVAPTSHVCLVLSRMGFPLAVATLLNGHLDFASLTALEPKSDDYRG